MARPRPDNLRADQVQTIKLPSGNALDRVHPAIYPGDQFNPSPSGDARFSPLIEGGMVVPTLYAGESLDCALMETLFHDVPYTDGPKRVRVKKINPLAHSSLRTLQEIEFADLSNIALRKLGLQRKDLIDTTAARYARSREWALAIRRERPDVQGLAWISRQHDKQASYVLFGDRLAPGTLALNATSALSAKMEEIIALADRLGVDLV